MVSDPNNPTQNSDSSSDDLSVYLQVFLDETAEELDALVEATLFLEGDPTNAEALNKAFRMLHSLKGSCGMMGFEVIGDFAHTLEDRFENYRSGKEQLDRDTTTLVLKCVDYFRNFTHRLRAGNPDEGDPSELIRQLNEQSPREDASVFEPEVPAPASVAAGPSNAVSMSAGVPIKVKFKPGLQLADLKARLIVARLSSIGEVISCEPKIEDVRSFDELPLFSLVLLTDRKLEEIRRIASVDGVDSIEMDMPSLVDIEFDGNADGKTPHDLVVEGPGDTAPQAGVTFDHENEPAAGSPVPQSDVAASSATAIEPNNGAPASPVSPESSEAKVPVTETLRIDIDRLDRLMNLTGELVVTNARFAEITSKMSPVFRRTSVINKTKDLTERLRHRLVKFERQLGATTKLDESFKSLFHGLEDDLDRLDEQSSLWDEGHRHFLEITEAVDQLTRVSKNLQRGVLNTRMVPVGPLLNRFKRVIRDLSVERGKKVQLVVHGENTELDRRMIDSLGDPLLHLVRNSIDHGVELPEERLANGKPAISTLSIEASHRGNNVLITVRDDGKGIDPARIRDRIVSRGIATEGQVREMSDQQVVDYIWHPGFSTADQISDISGRGVGMDIVQSTIASLSGTIEMKSVVGVGTTFTIRLPLTLAIIRSLLVRHGDGHFSIPIDDVREIVSVAPENIHAVHRHLTIDVRGELISLASMESIFDWGHKVASPQAERSLHNRNINVVLLNGRGKTLGLCVEALVGRADIVIKSLSENFIAIRGLSGASIMGDGSVCLMLDCAALIELASERSATRTGARPLTTLH